MISKGFRKGKSGFSDVGETQTNRQKSATDHKPPTTKSTNRRNDFDEAVQKQQKGKASESTIVPTSATVESLTTSEKIEKDLKQLIDAHATNATDPRQVVSQEINNHQILSSVLAAG